MKLEKLYVFTEMSLSAVALNKNYEKGRKIPGQMAHLNQQKISWNGGRIYSPQNPTALHHVKDLILG